MPYADAWALQQSLQRLLIKAKRGETEMPVPNFLLTVEHPPVYTLGKSGDESNLLASESDLLSRGASFFHTDRGGDITYHGPGQLVGYPILDLDRFFTDIGRYLRKLEEVIVRVCRTYGLSAGRVPGRTGVWIDVESGAERKIC
ncbi:MAG TPA: lipoyl(octanoyl) transferase LipB, partial [Rhodothermia bacterium]|nr:lipoyl(octanoyl) transferase LipB [Rhodothermia bacterium]